MKKTRIGGYAVAAIILVAVDVRAYSQTEICFDRYLDRVSRQNLEYRASRMNVDIADAAISAAKVLPDPSVDFGAARDNFSLGLSCSLELAKRRSRVRLARSEKEYERLALENSYQDMRAQAAGIFLDAVLQKELLAVRRSSYEYMERLSASDSLRFVSGEISEIDARQSRLEKISLLNDVYGQEAAYRSSLVEMNRFMGVDSDTLMIPVGSWKGLERDFSLPELLEYGMLHRTEMLMAAKSVEVNEKSLRVVKAERRPDIDLSLSYERDWDHFLPQSRYASVGVSLPLAFSAVNRGEVKAAGLKTRQAEVSQEDVRLQVCSEIRQAWFAYVAECRKVEQYRSGIMDESRKVLDGMVYRYRRGEASVLDVLVSQRTYNEVCQDYLDTMKGCFSALVALERACGFWDIHF